LKVEITRLGVDVLIVDPFVSCHRLPENHNGAIDAVIKTWVGIAEETNCAVELAHHVRKPSNGAAGAEFDVNDARGASSLIGGARSVRVLNVMSKDEAEATGVPEKYRRAYFRCESRNGKANMRPASDETDWHKFISVSLENETPDDPADDIGVVIAWKRPGLFDGMTTTSLFRVQKAIAARQWREDHRSPDWAGNAVASVLGLDATAPADKTKIEEMLKVWIKNKALKIVEKPGPDRHCKSFVEVAQWAT
jgi:AAA domain